MIEQGIYFGIGCALAGLCALAFAPILWARALRLTRQRLQVQIPVSMHEILADRDHLRAEFALDRRKLEQAMERVRASKAADMAELGRRAAKTLALSEALAAAEARRLDQDREIARQRREAAETGTELATLRVALHDIDRLHEQRMDEFRDLRAAHQILEDVLEQRRATVAALHTRVMGLEMTIEDHSRAAAAAERQRDIAGREAKALAKIRAEERDRLVTQMRAMEAIESGLRGRLSEEAARTSALEAAGQVTQIDFDAARARIKTLETELDTAMAALAAAKERERSLALQQSMRMEKARGVRLAPSRIDSSRAGAEPGADEILGATDAILRSSIHELGLAIAEMTLAAKIRPEDSAFVPDPARDGHSQKVPS